MTETILHVSDSLASIEQYETDEVGALGGLESVSKRAIDQQIDAVVHTGNLFRRPDPDQQLVDELVNTLEKLTDEDIPFFVIEGRREASGNGLRQLIDAGVANELTSEPTTVGDIALYGISNTGDEVPLLEQLAKLEQTSQYTYNIVCLHEQIWPPAYKAAADVSAYDVMKEPDIHVNAVLAGGEEEPRRWESDDFDYWVQYSGSTNPLQFTGGESARGYLVTASTDGAESEEIRLKSSEVDEELDQLKQVLEYQASDTADLETETIADLYGMTAHTKKLLEKRRKELRDELLDRVDDDCNIQGQYAEISRNTQRRRNAKDEETIFEILNRAGIDPEEVTKVDSSKLRELSDNDVIEEESVFDIEERTYIRLSDIDI